MLLVPHLDALTQASDSYHPGSGNPESWSRLNCFLLWVLRNRPSCQPHLSPLQGLQHPSVCTLPCQHITTPACLQLCVCNMSLPFLLRTRILQQNWTPLTLTVTHAMESTQLLIPPPPPCLSSLPQTLKNPGLWLSSPPEYDPKFGTMTYKGVGSLFKYLPQAHLDRNGTKPKSDGLR